MNKDAEILRINFPQKEKTIMRFIILEMTNRWTVIPVQKNLLKKKCTNQRKRDQPARRPQPY